MSVTVDKIGNVFMRRLGRNASLAPIVTGYVVAGTGGVAGDGSEELPVGRAESGASIACSTVCCHSRAAVVNGVGGPANGSSEAGTSRSSDG